MLQFFLRGENCKPHYTFRPTATRQPNPKSFCPERSHWHSLTSAPSHMARLSFNTIFIRVAQETDPGIITLKKGGKYCITESYCSVATDRPHGNDRFGVAMTLMTLMTDDTVTLLCRLCSRGCLKY